MPAGVRIATGKPVTLQDCHSIAKAVRLLREAQRLLGASGARNARQYAARAVKSAIGAHNHASAQWRHWGDLRKPSEDYAARCNMDTGSTRAEV